MGDVSLQGIGHLLMPVPSCLVRSVTHVFGLNCHPGVRNVPGRNLTTAWS